MLHLYATDNSSIFHSKYFSYLFHVASTFQPYSIQHASNIRSIFPPLPPISDPYQFSFIPYPLMFVFKVHTVSVLILYNSFCIPSMFLPYPIHPPIPSLFLSYSIHIPSKFHRYFIHTFTNLRPQSIYTPSIITRKFLPYSHRVASIIDPYSVHDMVISIVFVAPERREANFFMRSLGWTGGLPLPGPSRWLGERRPPHIVRSGVRRRLATNARPDDVGGSVGAKLPQPTRGSGERQPPS